MTPYDVAMVGAVVAGMVWGAMRGITWQLASIASLVLGYAVAYPLSAELAPRFPGEPVVARGLALLVAYAGVSGGVFLVAWLVRATLRRWKFEAFDRHLGMLLGGAEGVLLGVLATVIVLSVAPRSRRPILESPSGRFVGGLLREVQPLLPGEVRDMLAASWGGPGPVAVEEGPRRLLSLPRRDALVRPAAGAPSWTHPAEDPAPAGEGPDEAPGLRSLLHEGSARLGRALADELRRQAEQADQPYDGRIKRR